MPGLKDMFSSLIEQGNKSDKEKFSLNAINLKRIAYAVIFVMVLVMLFETYRFLNR